MKKKKNTRRRVCFSPTHRLSIYPLSLLSFVFRLLDGIYSVYAFDLSFFIHVRFITGRLRRRYNFEDDETTGNQETARERKREQEIKKKIRSVSGQSIRKRRDLARSWNASLRIARGRRVSEVREIRANATRRAVVADVSEIMVLQKTQPRETIVLVVDDFAEIKLPE